MVLTAVHNTSALLSCCIVNYFLIDELLQTFRQFFIQSIITSWVTITDQGITYAVFLTRDVAGEVVDSSARVFTALACYLSRKTLSLAFFTPQYSVACILVNKGASIFSLPPLGTEC